MRASGPFSAQNFDQGAYHKAITTVRAASPISVEDAMLLQLPVLRLRNATEVLIHNLDAKKDVLKYERFIGFFITQLESQLWYTGELKDAVVLKTVIEIRAVIRANFGGTEDTLKGGIERIGAGWSKGDEQLFKCELPKDSTV
jgi:hypothetical protein